MSPREFDAIVERAIGKIPARYRNRLQNLVFIVEQEPPRPGLLGLYHGRPMPLRSVSEPFAMPDKITIYQGPHERISRSLEELEGHVHDTVWHEIAHYFGLDEAEVQRAERRRIRQRRRKSILKSPPRS